MIDLHTHSTASDGSLRPAEVVALAGAAGITCLALTDHNTTAGLQEFIRAAEGTTIRPVPGVELSCECDPDELHILALNLPESAFSQIETVMADVLARAEESKRALTEALHAAGYDVDYDEIRAAHPMSVINRAHIAMALRDKGYVETVNEAFHCFLDEEAGYYHPARRLDAAEAIGIIRDLGAVPVWAHPFMELDEIGVRRILDRLVPAGLAGLETWYSTYTPQETVSALALTERYGLKPSGGSDFHGSPKPDIFIGVGTGTLCIPERVAEELLG